MKDTEDILFENQRRKRLSNQKVVELGRVLEKEDGSRGDFLSSNYVATNLFQRAPVDFLENRSLEELVRITRQSIGLVEAANKAPGSIQIATSSASGVTALTVALTDRPFIVTSISECLRRAGVNLRVYLHPILTQLGTHISLSHIEIDEVSAERRQLLERQISGVLQDLLLTTDDFTPMLVRGETLARVLESPTHTMPFPQTERQELADFLRWLTDGGLMFLGYMERRVGAKGVLAEKPSTLLGLARSDHQYRNVLLNETLEDAQRLLESDQPFIVTRLRVESPIHRQSMVCHLAFQEYSAGGDPSVVHSFIGLLTSKAVAEESSTIPVIRRKVKEILEVEEVVFNSHLYKSILDVVDNMPKEEALRLQVDELRGIVHTVLGLQNRTEARVSVRFDAAHRGASVLVVMPRERFNAEVRARLQQYMESMFGAPAGSGEYHLDLTNKPQVKFYFYIPLGEGEQQPVDLARLEADVTAMTRTWSDSFREQIFADGLFGDPKATWLRYENAFPAEYQAMQTIDDVMQDIKQIERLSADQPIVVSFSANHETNHDTLTAVLYSLEKKISLSQALPILEDAGLDAIEERCAQIRPRDIRPVFVHRVLVKFVGKQKIDIETFNRNAADGLAQVFIGSAENDSLNQLMLGAELGLRQISLLRTYCSLLWQVSGFASRSTILHTVAEAPEAARLLWNMFEVKFDPASKLGLAERGARFQELHAQAIELLRSISDITRDRILRSLINLLSHTVRTNYYTGSSTLAVKIHSEKADVMPQPRPLYEIFVHSPTVEGVHLRMGRVARGGIRWSDRHDDFRSEVLGLVKTQKLKNAIIVPTGAKGGFVVRNLPKDPSLVRTAVEQTYREFIRAILTISDNRTAKGVVHPAQVVVHDGEDPYLVVAADKGTATFSDTANKLAVEEFNFWLGDAFASGGSQGYDHKVYGITAKGGWECVKRHFHDLGLEYRTEPFTAVGIGDMAGDVFGNGLILSDQYRLLAAFNHAHIFIDPSPDPAKSFKERVRLFETPRTQWTDYNRDLISKGGGIYGRFDKEINLSPEARQALSIADDVPATLTGEQVINLILKAKVDLLWNGGIGTYIKSTTESHQDVNDRSNDRVRVSASEVRAKIIAEGGNLGVTQRGRVEYAERGGRLNLDAIDNSGGVDLSDHEVNLKILFTGLIRDKKITLEERNKLLKQMAGEVVEDVLRHNRDVAIAITTGEVRSRKNIEYFRSLISDVHKIGYVDRFLEVLPDDEELSTRAKEGRGLSRPELAVCLNAVKLWLKDVMGNSTLPRDPMLKQFLLDYFPSVIRNRFREEILAHPLAENIIAMQVSNTLIDSVGVSFVHRMCLAHSTSPINVIKCALAADLLLGMRQVREAILGLDNGKHNDRFIELRREYNKAMRHATAWLISNHSEATLEQIVSRYQKDYQAIFANIEKFISGAELERFRSRRTGYQTDGLPDAVATGLAIFPRIVIILELLWTVENAGRALTETAPLYVATLEELGVGTILKYEQEVRPANRWESELLGSSFQDIRRSVSMVLMQTLKKGITTPAGVREAIRRAESFGPYKTLLDDVKDQYPGVAAISVAAKRLRCFNI